MIIGQCLVTVALEPSGLDIDSSRPNGMAGLEALSVFNKPVFEAYEELSALVRQKRGSEVAQAFARPQRVDATLTWTTDLPGQVRRWIDLSPTERAGLEAERQRVGEALAGLVLELARGGPNTQAGNFGQILYAALEIPGPDRLFVVGDAVVLTFWGFRYADGVRFEPLAPVPPPPQPPPPKPPLLAPPMPTSGPRSTRRWLPLLLGGLVPAVLLGIGLTVWWHPDPSASIPTPAQTPPPIVSPPGEAPPKVEFTQTSPAPKPPVPVLKTDAPVETPSAVLPPVPAPDLPAQRWEHQDLSMLEGCWVLGKDYQTTYVMENEPGKSAGKQNVLAERLCLNANGKGRLETSSVIVSGPLDGNKVVCHLPVSARFDESGALVAQIARRRCTGNFTTLRNTYICRRQDNGTALCDGRLSDERNLWFRREGSEATPP
jgi:hypothetical protein